ncbi:EamA family transporter [Patescibacteria group bacterium]
MHWILLAFGAFLFIGLSNFGLEFSTHFNLNSNAAVLLLVLAQLLVVGIFFIATRTSIDMASSWKGVIIVLIAGLSLGIGVLFLGKAFASLDAKAGIVTLILNLNFILVTVLAYLSFKEALSIKQIVGMGVVIAGLILIV